MTRRPTRREYLLALGVTGATGLVGCSTTETGTPTGAGTATDAGTATPTATETPTESEPEPESEPESQTGANSGRSRPSRLQRADGTVSTSTSNRTEGALLGLSTTDGTVCLGATHEDIFALDAAAKVEQ